jgi:hypothetical protein
MRILRSLTLYILIQAAYGQALDLKHLDRLAARASSTVDVSLDGALLKLGAKFLSADDPDQAKVKRLVDGLKGIYVKTFEFEKEDEYSESDLTTIRSQLRASDWSRIVGVRSKRDGENVEVYIKIGGTGPGGLAVIAAEPKELTVVNIVGKIDLDQLSDIGGNFSIPKMDLEKSKPEPKPKPDKPDKKDDK